MVAQGVNPSGSRTPIRFGLQVNPNPDEIDRVAIDAEAAGFDVITVADHISPDLGSPLIVLSRMAGATSTIRLGTMVINNDMRNPVQLAWEAVSLHRHSGGRFELGLGAGHTPHEYEETGIDLDPAAVRKARLRESVEIITALCGGETLDYDGEHYRLRGASVTKPDAMPSPLPILVGGNGTALLTHAAEYADIIGLQGLGRTLEDGHSHTVKFGTDHLGAQIDLITEAAGDRTLELGALVQFCEVTDDREQAFHPLVERVDGLDMDAAVATPYLAAGTVEEIAAHFVAVQQRWGISYFTLRNPDLAPIISRVRELEAEADA